MKKPIIIFRKKKNTALLLMSVVILFLGLFIIYENKKDNKAIAVIAGQNEASTPNETIEDLFNKIME